MNVTKNNKRISVAAHRYALAKHLCVEINNELCAMHSCDNPSCVNPKHLKYGTWAENNQDRSAKGRSASRVYDEKEKEKYSKIFRGSGNPFAKLTEEIAKEIKYDRTLGCNRAAIKYGISSSSIKSIRSGRAWKHV